MQTKDDFSRSILINCCKDGTISYRTRHQEKVRNDVSLPVFSVDTVEQAQAIQVHFCRLQYGEYPFLQSGRPWYVLNDFSGHLDDLGAVTVMFREFYRRRFKQKQEEKKTPQNEYENPRYQEFVDDMKAGDFDVRHYRGRFFYEGPAVATKREDGPTLQDVIRATKIELQWDNLGLDYIVYPT